MTAVLNSHRGEGVLCVGRVYCDIIFTGIDKLPTLGEEQFASGVAMQAGGGAYITASHLMSLGRPASLLATLPAGPFASVIQKELIDSGIDTTQCVSSERSEDIQLTVALSMGGERAFVTKRSGSALPVQSVDWQAIEHVGHLHIGELATLIEYPTLIDDAHRAGVSVSVDCSWDDAMFERDDLANYLQGADIFLPNNAEFERLKPMWSQSEKLPLCVVKQGAEGATAHVNGEKIHCPAAAIDVKDTTGAGDAFNAGFIHAWLRKCSISACVSLGNQCGSHCVASVGGRAQPQVPLSV